MKTNLLNQNIFALVVIGMITLCATQAFCRGYEPDYEKWFLETEDVADLEFIRYKFAARGADLLPTIIKAVEKSLENPFGMVDIERLSISGELLLGMARTRVMMDDAIPILLRGVKESRLMGNAYIFAEALRILSGIDVGFTKEFADNFSEDQNDRLDKMIRKWEEWYKNKKSGYR